MPTTSEFVVNFITDTVCLIYVDSIGFFWESIGQSYNSNSWYNCAEWYRGNKAVGEY